MIGRYLTDEIASIWSGTGEFARLAEAAKACAFVSGGPDLRDAVAKALDDPDVDVIRWAKLEGRYDHDIAAFVEMIREQLPSDMARIWHRGRTSSDLVETALGLALDRSGQIIGEELSNLTQAVAELAHRTRRVRVMGRTHGQHAEPTSVGRKFALIALALADSGITPYFYAKLSGPVGTDSDRIRDGRALADAWLSAVPATQIVPRHRLATHVASYLPLLGVISTLATEIRLGSQTGVSWCAEVSPSAAARGSSAMPQKRNPIRSERAVGLCTVARHSAYAVLDGTATLWNERDISHSSVERTALVDLVQTTHFLLRDMLGVVRRLEIDQVAAAVGTDQPSGAAVLAEVLDAHPSLPHEKAYSAVRNRGPAGAAASYGVRGVPAPYNPGTEPELWHSIEALAE